MRLTTDNQYPGDRLGHHYICILCKHEYSHRRYMATRQERMRQTNQWRKTHHANVNQMLRRSAQRLKLKVMQHYSGKQIPECSNPFGQHKDPYTDIRALSIDHINGGGNRHLQALGFGRSRFYRWLKRNNYPSGFRVLCMNCQFVGRFESMPQTSTM